MKNLSDEIFEKFDEDGNMDLSLEEFLELCMFIDPKMDKKTCIEKYNVYDTDSTKTLDKVEF